MKRIIAAIVASLACLVLASCSAGVGPSKDVNAKAHEAYATKCQEYLDTYGIPGEYSLGQYGGSYSKGLSLVRLVDMNADGIDEMVLCVGNEDARNPHLEPLEVWSYKDGEIRCDYSGNVSLHGTNGYFPYVEVVPKKDSGYVLSFTHCMGSAPATFVYTLVGYSDGKCDTLAQRSTMGFATYDCYEGRPSDGKQVSEARYEQLFVDVVGNAKPSIHDHLFNENHLQPDCEARNLAETLSETRSVLESLGVTC